MMYCQQSVRVVLLCLGAFRLAHASISWISSLDGPTGVPCSVTCGSKLSLQAFSSNSIRFNVTPEACAVNNITTGSQIGTLWYNKNMLSCQTYSRIDGHEFAASSSSWYCPCLDATTVVTNITGSSTETCSSSCSKLAPINGTFYNSSITSCTRPSAQSICLDPIQNSFGYQPTRSDGNSNVACLTTNAPAQTTADTVPAQTSTNFQCLCSDANSTAIQISDSCSSVPTSVSPPGPAPVGLPQSDSLSTGAIVGIAVGCAAGVAVLATGVTVYLYIRRRPAKPGSLPSKPISIFETDNQPDILSDVLVGFEDIQGKGGKSIDESSSGSGLLSSSEATIMTTAAKPSDMTGSTRSLANIIELQNKRQDISTLELGQVPNIWTGSEMLGEFDRTASGNDALKEVGLLETWKIEPTDLHVRMLNGKPALLGEGGYGKVYRGVLNKADVAIKVVTSHDGEQQAKFVQEIVTLRACHNTHIVQFLGACIRDQQTFMAMEFMQCGDLFSKIDKDISGRFSWYNLGHRIAMDVCKGLCYLHSKHIAHLDLKSPNVLLTSNYTAKIGDVGLGKIISNRRAVATRQGSLFWAAPEQLLGTECSTASDMFAFGTVLWEICSGEQPYNRQVRPLRVPEEAPEDIEELIIQCHAEKPDERPTADQAFEILRAAARRLRPAIST